MCQYFECETIYFLGEKVWIRSKKKTKKNANEKPTKIDNLKSFSLCNNFLKITDSIIKVEKIGSVPSFHK